MYAALDIHKRFSQFAVSDDKGQIVNEGRFANEDENFEKFLNILEDGTKIVMEACSLWEPAYDFIESNGFDVVLAHPLKTKAIAAAKVKTDSLDAKMLVQLLRADLIHRSLVPSHKLRRLRFITRHRTVLTRIRTKIKNYIHSILMREGITTEYTNILGKRSIESLQKVPMKPEHKFAINNCIELARTINELIELTNLYIESVASDIAEVKLLTTIPGVGLYSATTIYAEIGGIENFKDWKKLCSFAGMIPSVHQSGDTLHLGHITKQGNKWLRWITIQSTIHTVRKKNGIGKMYRRLMSSKKGAKKARVACARKLLVCVFIMLTQKIEFGQLRMNSV